MTDQQNPVQPMPGVNPAPAPLAPTPMEPTPPASAVPPVSYVDDYQPPAAVPNSSPVPAPAPVNPMPMTPISSMMPTAAPISPAMSDQAGTNSISQTLEDQNIFFLLGVDDGSDEEKESFLDELQQVIWEDFLENDVQLLITEEENQGLKQIQAKTDFSEEDKQEEMVVYLEKLIPDLEEIMLEKALELKEDMVRERIAGMRDYYADKPAELQKLDQAEALLKDDKWRDAAAALNSLKA